MSSACQRALSGLVGLRLRKVGRAGLAWFSFGPERERTTRRGEVILDGTHALHLQCPWRLRDEARVWLAADDRWAARTEPNDTDPAYDCDALGTSWFDARSEPLNQRLTSAGACALRPWLCDRSGAGLRLHRAAARPTS